MALTASSVFSPASGATKAKLRRPFGFERAHGSAGQAAQVECGKRLGFAAAQKQQPFGFQFRRPVQQRVFENLASHLAASDHIGGRVFDGGVGGFNRDLRFVLFAAALFRFVEHDRDQAFGFYFGRIGEGKISFHVVCGSSIVGGKGIAQEAAAHHSTTMVIPRLRLPRSVSCFSSGRALMRAHACSSDLAQSLAENAGTNLASTRHLGQTSLRYDANVAAGPARSIAVDQLQDSASCLPGASQFTLQMLQGFGDGRHPGFEVYGFDGTASAV